VWFKYRWGIQGECIHVKQNEAHMMEENSPMGFTIAAIIIVFVVRRRRHHFVVTAEALSVVTLYR
jgi:hypothetical protein